MKQRWFSVIVSVLVFAVVASSALVFGLSSARADEPGEKKAMRKDHLLTQVLMPNGRRVLCVNYPCASSPHTSVEIRILDKKTIAEPHLTSPLFFQKRILGETNSSDIRIKDVFDGCYTKDTDDMLMETLTYKDAKMKIFGWKSVFGPREAAVLYEVENKHTGNKELTLIFPEASHCPFGENPKHMTPFDMKVFAFDMLPPMFDNPCELIVWVINGDRVLIQDRISWKGKRGYVPLEEKTEKVEKKKRSADDEDEEDEEEEDEEEEEEDEDEDEE